MSVKEVLNVLQNNVNEDPQKIIGFRAVYQFELSGADSGTFQIKFSDDRAVYEEGTSNHANCTMELSDSNFIKLVKGELNPTAAFMMGKIKIKGDIGLALKLQQILEAYR